MRSQHIWTDRDQHGKKREVRATKFGGAWRFQAKAAGDLEWTYYEHPLPEDLLALKEILARKYQRRRASAEDVASVEKLIADEMGVEAPRRDVRSVQRAEPHDHTLMIEWNTEELIEADKRFVWHPFTDMREWCAAEHEPLVLVEGRGALLRDSRGREYIDGNSSIWTNIHGHNHPHINAAIRRQLSRVAHTSFLGFTNPAAIELAQAIVALFPNGRLNRVFFSDDGSTGIEVALRVADQYWRLRRSRRHQFIAFRSGYHGDTAGAASLGAAAMFQGRSPRWKFPSTQVSDVQALEALTPAEIAKIAAVVIEPLVQGAAGMRLWPSGTLRAVREWCTRTDTPLIVDEVMTGFGRTGRMFASEHEGVIPDMMVLGKGLSGGYLPLAITLISEQLFSEFNGSVAEGKALAYGHSYTGNALGCAAAKASLEVFENERVLEALQPKIQYLSSALVSLKELPGVKEVRQCGFIAGIETARAEMAAAVCIEARRHGLLTRPIWNVVVLMPPLCITMPQLTRAVEALRASITEVSRSSNGSATKNVEEITA